MKKCRVSLKSITVLLALIVALAMSTPVFAADAPAAPSVKAKAAYIYCGDTGEVLYSKKANTKYDPLSTTKLLTAYIVMKKGINLNKTIKISKQTASTPWMSSYHLKKGEKIKVKYLMYFALLPSENDAAAALGQAVSGNKTKFAKLMNKEARALGCTNSKFTNAHGCIESNYSTAHDMALITRAAFKYSFIRKVCATKKYTIPKTNKHGKRYLLLTNWFFRDGSYKSYSIVGGKTGTWSYKNAALVEYSMQNGRPIYTVVMKDKTTYRYSDTKKLITYSKEYLTYKTQQATESAAGSSGSTTAAETNK